MVGFADCELGGPLLGDVFLAEGTSCGAHRASGLRLLLPLARGEVPWVLFLGVCLDFYYFLARVALAKF